MTKLSIDFESSGPFFTHDPKRTVRQNIRDMLDGLVAEGERAVVSALASGEGTRHELSAIVPARTSAHVRGRVRSHSGKRWAVTGVVGVVNAGLTTKEAQSLMAGGSRVESETHVFRTATSAMRKSRAVVMAELARGLT